MQDGGDTASAHGLYRVDQITVRMEFLHVVAAADGAAVDQDVGDGAAAGGKAEGVLQAWAEWVVVEFHHEWSWGDVVEVLEDVLEEKISLGGREEERRFEVCSPSPSGCADSRIC